MTYGLWVRPIATSLLALAVASPVSGQAKRPHRAFKEVSVARRQFFSASLQREMPYMVLLPANYNASHRRYAVLYLLHGWQGDETNWVKLTHLVEDAGPYPLIIVAPRAENSWYVNSATVASDRFQDYVLDDLIRDVDDHYRTIVSPRARAVAGISMGGYGAILFALLRPQMFAVAASVSGAFSGPSGIEEVMPWLQASTDAAFGPVGNPVRQANDVDSLVGHVEPSQMPYLFLECGSSDPLLPSSRKLVAELSAAHFAYEYHEYPGAHTWSFWDAALPSVLHVVAEKLHTQPDTTETIAAHDVDQGKIHDAK